MVRSLVTPHMERRRQVVIHLFFMHNVRVHGFDPGFQEGFSWSFLYVKEEKINTYIHGIHGDWCQPPSCNSSAATLQHTGLFFTLAFLPANTVTWKPEYTILFTLRIPVKTRLAMDHYLGIVPPPVVNQIAERWADREPDPPVGRPTKKCKVKASWIFQCSGSMTFWCGSGSPYPCRTNGSGSECGTGGSCYFRQSPSSRQQKNNF
jgi:hypothetical protein